MRALGVNTVRTYTVPSRPILDAAADAGLRLMVGIPWSQHVAFLDDPATSPDHPAHASPTASRSCATIPAC